MNLQPVARELAEWLAHSDLDAPTNLSLRQKALDFVRYVKEIERYASASPGVNRLVKEAMALQQRITAVNQRFFANVRHQVQTGRKSPKEWRAFFDQFTSYRPGDANTPSLHMGFDGLDLLVNGMLNLELEPERLGSLEPEMVHYEPSPARIALDLVDQVGFCDRDSFCDVGAGLGRIAVLVHLLSGVNTCCLELEPAYCQWMRHSFVQLNLTAIEVCQGDARSASYEGFTVFYLFTPFWGKMLESVLARLQAQAERRPIVICAYGTVCQRIGEQPWLHAREPQRDISDFALEVFSSEKNLCAPNVKMLNDLS